MPNFGAIFGLISAGMGLTAGISPLLLGRLYEATGSYRLFVALAVAAAGMAALAVFRLGPYPDHAPVQPGDSDGVQGQPAAA